MTVQPSARPTPDPATPNEMWKAIHDEHRAQISALTTRLVAQRRELRQFHEGNSRGNEFAYARGKKEASEQVAELRSALDEARLLLSDASQLIGHVTLAQDDFHRNLAVYNARAKPADSSGLFAGHRGLGSGLAPAETVGE